MNSESMDVLHSAKRLAIRHVRDVLEMEDVAPLVRRQLADEVGRAVQRLPARAADEFRAIYEEEFTDALDWARAERATRREREIRWAEEERIANDLRRFRFTLGEHAFIRTFVEPEVRQRPAAAKGSDLVHELAPAALPSPKVPRSTWPWWDENKYFIIAILVSLIPVVVSALGAPPPFSPAR